jgi:hypothetical protein
MLDRIYLVRLKAPSHALQQVRAATFEVHGDHLVFLTENGKLATLFLLDLVESWNEDRFLTRMVVPTPPARRGKSSSKNEPERAPEHEESLTSL